MLCLMPMGVRGDIQGQDGNPGEIFRVLIHRLLSLARLFMRTLGQAQLSPWSCGQWSPLAFAKRPLESAGLAQLQPAGPDPQLHPGLGRNAKPRPLLAIKKISPNIIIPFTILASFQLT